MQLSPLDLSPQWYHLHLPETDSTMLRLRDSELMQRTEEFILLTADYQTAGRGQRNTSWEADAEENLLFGFLFHPQAIPAIQQFSLSEALALAVAEALMLYTDRIRVKWPNDIYWNDRKICGMLLEHDLCGSHIATTLTGIGINVNQKVFHSDAPNPVSLYQITGKPVSREKLLTDILQNFEVHYRELQHGHHEALHRKYMSLLYRNQGFHTFRDASGTFEAEIADISPMGMLTLHKASGGQQTYAFKEVAFVI